MSSSGSRYNSLKIYCQGQPKVNSLGLSWTPGASCYNFNATDHPPTKLLSKGPSINGLIKTYVSIREHIVLYCTYWYCSLHYGTVLYITVQYFDWKLSEPFKNHHQWILVVSRVLELELPQVPRLLGLKVKIKSKSSQNHLKLAFLSFFITHWILIIRYFKFNIKHYTLDIKHWMFDIGH